MKLIWGKIKNVIKLLQKQVVNYGFYKNKRLTTAFTKTRGQLKLLHMSQLVAKLRGQLELLQKIKS